MAYVYSLVQQAVKRGELTRSLTCEACGQIRATFAHHDDYLKPLEVRWLCKPCHQEWHNINGPGLNAEIADLRPAKYHDLPEEKRKAKLEQDDLRFSEMTRLIADGWTLQKVGDHYGISRERVRQIVGTPTQYRRSFGNKAVADVEARTDEINAMRRAGKSVEEIASALDLKQYAIQRIVKRLDRKELVHGTLQGYRRGCRCDLCKPQNSMATKACHKRMREQGRCIVCCKPSGGKQKCRPCYEKWYLKYGRTGKLPNDGCCPPGRSGVKHIGWHSQARRWRVYRYIDRKQVHLASFKDLDEAKRFNATLDEKGKAA